MKRFGYILIAVMVTLSGCHGLEPLPSPVPEPGQSGDRVTLSFKVAVPGETDGTRAMGNNPTIDPDGFYIAVFGGSGYFNEWVKATVASASPANYDGTAATVYSLTAELSISDSRLRLHFIANCPTDVRTSPPISGSQDTEEYVLSRIRSKHTETYNDAYWQKVILPNGIRVRKVVEQETEYFVATDETMAQFPDPIILVRNFARVYLRNLTENFVYDDDHSQDHQLVTIKKFGLAYAPSEGVVAPILSAPFITDAAGNPIPEPADNDNTTKVYYENFLINYQRYPIIRSNQSDTLLTEAPFNYRGFSPSNQAYNYYPDNDSVGIPGLDDLQVWDNENPENNVLFVYERTVPSAARRATRLIIYAERVDALGNSDGDRFYALDIVNTEGVAIPLLRNQSYTVHLLNIEAGSGETDISKATTASSATVTGDPTYQSFINISDGKSSIGTSFTEKFYVKPQLDSLMFRYIPTNITDDTYEANQEGNELVTIQVGSMDSETGVFTQLTAAQAASQGVLTFATEADTCEVWIVKDNAGKAIPFVRDQNEWVEATQAQIEDSSIEKWGMVKYQLSEAYMSEGFFSEARTQAIHVEGSYDGRTLSRNVVIKTSPRQTMNVTCQQKYVMPLAGQQEVVRVRIPKGLSRSVFPLEFTIEAAGYSLTPNGDVLPVTYGSSTVPGVNTPAFYYIKTLTQTDYDNLPTEGDWKYFDCNFKTTVANNACVVYVRNKYFSDATAQDEFFNFTQRLFSFPNQTWSPTSIYRKDNVQLTFRLDYEHQSATSCVWWDPADPNSLSDSYRVLPPVITVVLNGFTPQYKADGETPETAGLSHYQGNIYTYTPDPGELGHLFANGVTLRLTASGQAGSNGSVTLSTANLTSNPALYTPATSSPILIQGLAFSGLSYSGANYTNNRLALGQDKAVTFNFSYQANHVEPVTVILDGLVPDGNAGANAFLTDNGDGTYTFTPTNPNTRSYSLALKTTTRFSVCNVTLSSDEYTTNGLAANRATSFNIPANALYARNATNGNLNNFTTNTTYINLNNVKATGYLSRSRFSGSYLNSAQMAVDLGNFTISNDDAPVYFNYTGNNTTYYAVSSLSELLDATSSNRVTLRFKGSKVVTINPRSNSTNTLTYSGTDATLTFSALTRVSNNNNSGYVAPSNGSTLTVSTTSGYHISSFEMLYRSGYNPNSVTVVSGEGSYSAGNNSGTWTASNETTSSVELRMNTCRIYQVAVTLEEN